MNANLPTGHPFAPTSMPAPTQPAMGAPSFAAIYNSVPPSSGHASGSAPTQASPSLSAHTPEPARSPVHAGAPAPAPMTRAGVRAAADGASGHAPSPSVAPMAPPVVPANAGKEAEVSGAARKSLFANKTKKVATDGPRRVRVNLSRIDPWSAMKMSFLLSIAGGIMLFVAASVLWNTLNDLGLFTQFEEFVTQLFGGESEINLLQFVSKNKIMSTVTLLSVLNVIVFTALGTIWAFLYNTVARLVGGVYMTLTDD